MELVHTDIFHPTRTNSPKEKGTLFYLFMIYQGHLDNVVERKIRSTAKVQDV